MNHVSAIVEREMRKFFKSSSLMIATFVFPLLQLVVLGNAFGGKIRDAKLGIVDEDQGPQALRIHEAFDAVRANIRTFVPIAYLNDKQAVEDMRIGKIQGAVLIPPQYSRRVYEQNHPRIVLIVDNSDNFLSTALQQKMAELTEALNQPDISARILQKTALETVELYPYIEYIKYLLPGSIALSMFVSVMIGGGILYIDDKARGVYEGYLVTPITKTELILGLNLAGSVKAILAGVGITVMGSLLAGVGSIFEPSVIAGVLIMTVVTAVSFNTMVFLLVIRVEDPQLPRAIIGTLNTLLFFPSGAVYPVQAFPLWLQLFAKADPLTYVVHGFKALLLRQAGLAAIWPDVLFLTLFAMLTLGISTALFKRTL